jgi:hypothetical protein
MQQERDCPECDDGKRKAEARAHTTDGLQLGACAPAYQAWAECVKLSRGGPVKTNDSQCAEVLKLFKECHAQEQHRTGA